MFRSKESISAASHRKCKSFHALRMNEAKRASINISGLVFNIHLSGNETLRGHGALLTHRAAVDKMMRAKKQR